AFALVLATFGVLATMQTGIWRDSETLFRDVIKKQPDSVAAHLNLAIIDRETGRLDEALSETRAAFAIEPRMEVYTNFANIYKLRGQTDLAKAEYEKAAAAFPDKPEPQMGLGIIAQEQGRTEDAIAVYKRAIALDPQFTAAYVNLGSTYEHADRLAEAEAALAKAMEINPRFADGWQALGIVHEREEKFAEAAADYRKALALNPAMTDTLISLAAVELRQGHNGVALDILKGILKTDPNNEAAKALINEMIKMGIIGTK
ncbi:MAG TPA: tetratricopeptide repeat protein, partial [Candidatus Peribacteria bacterium]|nr:tetratricopeptide repeat protein [Candidatus Peribacteria bacterium]